MTQSPAISPIGANIHPLATAESVSARVLFERLQQGGACRVLDVRTGPEFEAAHLKGSVHQPLDQLNPTDWIPVPVGAPTAGEAAAGPLYVMCQAGGRAGRAGQLLARAGVPCFVVEGGLDAWTAAGFPVERGASRVLPLMRQVQIVVGLVSGTGSALALFKNPLFAVIPLLMGAGLLFAGLSGTCGLALLLARMPWNKSKGAGGTPPAGNGGGSCCAPSTHTGAGGAR